MTYERILVPLDGSPLAEAVLPHATAIAQKFNSELILLQVVPTFTSRMRETAPTASAPAASELSVDLARQLHSAERAAAKTYLEQAQQQLRTEGVLNARGLVEEGIPSRTILEVAKATDSNLIAMSTHGRTGIGRAVFGSVSDAVLRASTVPVLLVRPEG